VVRDLKKLEGEPGRSGDKETEKEDREVEFGRRGGLVVIRLTGRSSGTGGGREPARSWRGALGRRLGARSVAAEPGLKLVDAQAAGEMLGVPHTWLLTQARAGKVPHHRLGHYVRFDAVELTQWLAETRCGPPVGGERG